MSSKKKRKGAKGKPKRGGIGEQHTWRYSLGEREQAVERMALGANVSALARELGVHRNLLYYWRRRKNGRELPAAGEQLRVRELEARITTLEGALGRKSLEADFFASALRRVEETRGKRSDDGGQESTGKSNSGTERRKAD